MYRSTNFRFKFFGLTSYHCSILDAAVDHCEADSVILMLTIEKDFILEEIVHTVRFFHKEFGVSAEDFNEFENSDVGGLLNIILKNSFKEDEHPEAFRAYSMQGCSALFYLVYCINELEEVALKILDKAARAIEN